MNYGKKSLIFNITEQVEENLLSLAYLLLLGAGKVVVNGKDVNEYMPYETLVTDLKQPLTLTETDSKYDVRADVKGGGFTGQAGAIRLGIARALLEAGVNRSTLKVAGMLTRDSRSKERKKYGLKAARRASTI